MAGGVLQDEVLEGLVQFVEVISLADLEGVGLCA